MQSFRSAAYCAKERDQLESAFNLFLSEVAALPPGDWDEDALLRFINDRKEARLRKGWPLVHSCMYVFPTYVRTHTIQSPDPPTVYSVPHSLTHSPALTHA